jgi:hypothetical protein
MADYLAEVRRM